MPKFETPDCNDVPERMTDEQLVAARDRIRKEIGKIDEEIARRLKSRKQSR